MYDKFTWFYLTTLFSALHYDVTRRVNYRSNERDTASERYPFWLSRKNELFADIVGKLSYCMDRRKARPKRNV